MTLLYTDGFEHQDVVSRGWGIGGGVSYLTGASTRFAYGYCLRPTNGGGSIKRGFVPSAKIIMGVAWNLSYGGNLGTSAPIMLMGDNGQTAHLSLRRNPNSNTVALLRGNTQIATGPDTVGDGWHYIELSATIHATTGRAIVKVDGQPYIDFTGNTKNGGTNLTIDALALSASLYSGSTDYDDLYICDGLGSTNNDFLGDKRVVTLVSDKAGSTTAFQPTGSPNNFDNINELPVSAADYNSSSTVGARDLYGLASLPNGVKDVAGVQAVSVGLKSDAGNAFFKSVVKSGGATVAGPSVALATSLFSSYHVLDLDPAISAPWTPTAVNALNVGAEVTAS